MPDHDRQRAWIRPLPERLINKIAAGEVVERPAAVVKELVENALDAGATRIEIIVERSGTRLIKIVDNGCGISEEQLEIAFSRHATSKIFEFEDLDRITSYGFRGEALPSIASVSRMRMVSRTAAAQSGTEIIYEGGVLQSQEPLAAAPGSTVEVENLFFNTPARRKFLKAETTEARHISRAVTAMALGRYDVAFTYRLNGRSIFTLNADSDLRARVPSLLAPGKEFLYVSGQAGPLTVEGYISPPDLAQSNRLGQYMFINERYVHSPTLAHAFLAGYGELLPKRNFPIGALLLSIDPTEVDVNAHPAKTEVRLSREREIHDALYHLIKQALRDSGVIPSMVVPGAQFDQQPASRSPVTDEQTEPGQSHKIPGITRPDGSAAQIVHEMFRNTHPVVPGSGQGIVQVDTATGEIMDPALPSEPASEISAASGLRLIGRFDALYLLFQSGHDLLIIDQHTAHERVLYEEMLRRLDDRGSDGQHLLLPVQVELTPEKLALFEEARETLQHSGFGVEPFGGRSVRIEAVPAVLTRLSPEKAFLAVLEDIGSLRKTGYDLKKAIAQSVACRSAVMAGDRLSDQEATAVVARLLKCENRYSCPHGRPTMIKLSRSHLDKQFGRG